MVKANAPHDMKILRHDLWVAGLIASYTAVSAFGIADYLTGRYRLGNILCLWYFAGLVLFIASVRRVLNSGSVDKSVRVARLLIFVLCLSVIFGGVFFSISYRLTHDMIFPGVMYLRGLARNMEKNADLICIHKWMEEIPEREVRIDSSKWPDCVKQLRPVYVYIGSDKMLYFALGGFPNAIYRVIPKGSTFPIPSDALAVKGGFIELSKK